MEKKLHWFNPRIFLCLVIFSIITLLFGITAVHANVDSYNCAAYGHKDVMVDNEPATEQKNGYITYQCEYCKRTYTEILYFTDHNWSDWSVVFDATCTEFGLKERTCTLHGTHTETEKIPAGHTYTETVTQPACTKPGVKHYECTVCGYSYSEEFGVAAGHKYKETVTTPAACGVEGVKTFTCQICKNSYTKPIDALQHEYSQWIIDTPAGEGTEGKQHKECANGCGEHIEEIIPALPVSQTIASETVAHTEPETELPLPVFNTTDAVITSVNILALLFFSFLLFSDFYILTWIRKRKVFLAQKKAENLLKQAQEDQDDDFI